jgi:hypothetical protein
MSKPYSLIDTASDTFGGWITKTNDLITDMTTIIVTTDQGSGTGITTGNAHIQGVLSSNTLIATGSLRGGNTTTAADLTISSNVVFTGPTLTATSNVAIGGNLTLSAANRTLSVAGSTNLIGAVTISNTAQAFVLSSANASITTTGNTTITSAGLIINNPVTVDSNSAFTANGASITSLNATQLTSGTVPDARIASTIARSNTAIVTPAGAGITGGGDLTASRTLVVDGTVIPYLANNQTFSGTNTFPNLRTSGNMLPSANNTLNIGSATLVYANMFAALFNGTATSARYADLAEKYLADQDYEVGTVIAIGGSAEVTAADVDNAHSVLGVVSDKPAYLMNSDLEGGTTVALKGRVPVKVIGGAKKGDRLAPSTTAGYAWVDNTKGAWSFAIALEDGSLIVEAVIL